MYKQYKKSSFIGNNAKKNTFFNKRVFQTKKNLTYCLTILEVFTFPSTTVFTK